ncbi:hypothetical protein [Pleurocapsa sp. FMAR1]|uniref:hypothetical protein n=1 Tax=Pleurocapsa sp. FMAR1 TaxID=3040204 RepID=UPI0029C8BC96|nr:hypothetical protein [Pleurocapsa sp. FMAR1]
MNSDLFNDFCRRGSESKLELIDDKLIVGNTIVGNCLLLRQILQGWGAEAAVALASISLWIEALAASLELDQRSEQAPSFHGGVISDSAEIKQEDLRGTILDLKAIAATKEFALGVEAIERFVSNKPLRKVHECIVAELCFRLWQTYLSSHTTFNFSKLLLANLCFIFEL